MMRNRLKKLIAEYRSEIDFTLVDLGASGETHEPFELISEFSTRIEFDPDDRDFQCTSTSNGVIKVNKAVTGDSESSTVPLYLTKNPHCTSILEPIPTNAHAWPYGSSFEIERIAEVSAVTMDTVCKELKKNNIDWLKIDIQGADGRVLYSLSEQLMDSVLVCETEPGYCDHYKGADSFGDIHAFMLKKGFYLAAINEQSQIRMRSDTYIAFRKLYSGLWRKFVEASLVKSPTAPELLYLRTIESAEKLNFTVNQWKKLWLLSLASGQYEYGYDVAVKMQSFQIEGAQQAVEETLGLISHRALLKAPTSLLSYLKRKFLA